MRRVGIEGMETDAQTRALRQLGCTTMQGYLFGKPVPVSEFGRPGAPMLTELVA